MDYKLIAIDMDGTLLNSKNEISENNMKAIREATEKGIHIVLSTGRILSSAEFYADSMNLSSYILASNGAVISDGEKNIIYRVPINKGSVKEVMRLGRKHNVYYHFYDETKFYTNNYIDEIYEFYNPRFQKQAGQKIGLIVFKDDEEILEREDINAYKFLFLDDDREKLNGLKQELLNTKGINVSTSWFNNVEVMSDQVSKGLSLKYLCNMLNINRENTIAIGDNENDLSMIEFAGLGVAMGNGEDIVKKNADIITDTNDNDGVSKIIEQYVLK
ncbi:Cof-type HAD-IIB family hydrolase [Paratissierella segnis]|jgi:hypothetical protein|uniref:HAD family phosphatase n=1 Tax=Paratissierella segnis TaxID=2763679 RepID=A0A926EV77_9FIRM|nr:Cof-type HAD-IIB family hydrolase [Paratissierella segnis]MBC8589526.1 HAD family phosphatase [Paratissierella segnis]